MQAVLEVSPRHTGHSFEEINWEDAETETRVGVLQEMVQILLRRLEDRVPASALRRLVDVLDRHPEAHKLDSGELGGEYAGAIVHARGILRMGKMQKRPVDPKQKMSSGNGEA